MENNMKQNGEAQPATKVTGLKKFFWDFAGSEIHFLQQCPTDHSRHMTMGMILFTTWLVASSAGGIAGWFFSHNVAIAIIVGLIWGVLIYGIDRGMVVSLKKDPEATKQKFWGPLIMRGTLGVLISFFISIPVEILIFHKTIEDYGTLMITDRAATERNERLKASNVEGDKTAISEMNSLEKALEKQIENIKNNAEYKSYLDDETAKIKKINELGNKAVRLQNSLINAKIQGNTNEIQRLSVLIRENNANLKINRRELSAISKKKNQKYNDLYKPLSEKLSTSTKDKLKKAQIMMEKEKQADSALANKRTKLEENDNITDFVFQYEVLEFATKKSNKLLFLVWLVRTIFMVIEVAPTFYKLQAGVGGYDILMHSQEKELKVMVERNRIDMQEKLEQDRKEKKESYEKNKSLILENLYKNQEHVNNIADKEREEELKNKVNEFKKQEIHRNEELAVLEDKRLSNCRKEKNRNYQQFNESSLLALNVLYAREKYEELLDRFSNKDIPVEELKKKINDFSTQVLKGNACIDSLDDIIQAIIPFIEKINDVAERQKVKADFDYLIQELKELVG
jgi:hypothetical protein